MYTIYALIDPRDYTTRYVGISRDVYKRFIQHIRCVEDNELKNAWMRELQQINMMVIMQTLGTAETYEQAMQFEAQWIRDYHSVGSLLFNKDRVPNPVRNIKTGQGRKHAYDKTREVILFRHRMGDWPADLSSDMKRWYQLYYFTKPNKSKDGEKYQMHKKSYERGRRWIAETKLLASPESAREEVSQDMLATEAAQPAQEAQPGQKETADLTSAAGG